MEERGEVVSNKALEEFRERLERWDELCSQLRELYYKYLDLAAFRSDKCYFPGRKCRRSWGRKYDPGDLTLMWLHITNTAPLCGKLMKALAEVEYKICLRALESLEKYGGVLRKSKPDKESRPNHEIKMLHLNKPIYAYLVVWKNRLYVIWKEFDKLPKNKILRSIEIENRITILINKFEHGKNMDIPMEIFDIDEEYKRLWLEVSLPTLVSDFIGRKTKVPLALFRNLGWLLSDDWRGRFGHGASNSGQIALRLFDWIALAKYAIDVLRITQDKPLVYRLKINRVTKSGDGYNPLVEVWPIGTTAKTLRTVYDWFGITLGRSYEVLMRGYTVLKALREKAFKREGLKHVVDDVGAWIAFSNIVATLIIGDGYVSSYRLIISAKPKTLATLEGTQLLKTFVDAVGGVASASNVFPLWHMRLLLPSAPTPAFKKTAKLYEALANYPVAAVVEVGNVMYVLNHKGDGRFSIGKEKGRTLYEVTKHVNIEARLRGGYIFLTYSQLEELSKHGLSVRLLNDMEKDIIREVKTVSVPDIEAVKAVLEEVAKMARIILAVERRREYIRIIPYDKSKLEEIAAMLKAKGIRVSVVRGRRKEVRIYERRTVEVIRNVVPHFFTSLPK